MTWLTIDQAMAMCMKCSHCDKPAKHISLLGNATRVPRYCDEHVPWKDDDKPIDYGRSDGVDKREG